MVVAIQNGKRFQSWTVPHLWQPDVERTICLLKKDLSRNLNMNILISTSNKKPIKGTIKMEKVKNYFTNVGMNYTAHVSFGTPTFHYVDLTNITGLVRINVTSEDGDECGGVSIYPLKCPINSGDEDKIIHRQSIYKRAVLTIDADAEDYENEDNEKGFFILFRTYKRSLECDPDRKTNDKSTTKFMQLELRNPLKTYKFTVTKQITFNDLTLDWVLTIIFISGIALLLSILIILHYRLYKPRKQIKVALPTNITLPATTSHPIDDENTETDQAFKHKETLAEMVQRANNSNASYSQNYLYIWLVLLMGITYIIPAMQLVWSHQKMIYSSGNTDLCYYNYLCSVPRVTSDGRIVSDFNKIFSNIGYMIYGIVFLIIIFWRSAVHHKKRQAQDQKQNPVQEPVQDPVQDPEQDPEQDPVQNPEQDPEQNPEQDPVQNPLLDQQHQILPQVQQNSYNNQKTGIPQYFGIYYAAGFGLIGEAILSACYHVCPTDENFQFDTTFMYVISVLAIVKTYQFRHPDVTASAYKIFFGIALLLLLNVTGIFLNGTLFWIVGFIIYFYFLSHLFFVIYYHGKWRRPWQIKLVDNLVCIFSS